MPQFIPTTWFPILVGGVGTLLLIALWIWLRRRRAGTVEQQLRGASFDLLANFLIPDGNDGEILVEYALLTPRGVMILEVKDVEGHVFGSDAMQDWTVISNKRRYTFTNPQAGLYDRIAAVKRLLPEIPVKGFIAFSSRAEFSKGRPAGVIILEDLLDELRREERRLGGGLIDAFRPHWDRLRHEAVTAQFGQLLRE